MTRATYKARGALENARALRSLLQELFSLSLRQMELLEAEQYDVLEDVLAKKGAVLQMLPLVMQAALERGWDLQQPSTFPADPACAGHLREAASLSARVQAHERYCLGEMIARRNRIGDHLTLLASKRNAAAGYRSPVTRGHAIDTSR